MNKVVIAGNHDVVLDETKATSLGMDAGELLGLRWGSVQYLQDSTVSLKFRGGRTLSIYGSPWTRKHGNWAFQYEKEVDVFSGRLDSEADILVTHSPPKNHMDLRSWGDGYLRKELERVRPRLHVFGHIHGGYGKELVVFDRFEDLYEKVVDGKSGVFSVLWMILILLFNFVGWGICREATVLVNASAIGGQRDELRNEPWVVSL